MFLDGCFTNNQHHSGGGQTIVRSTVMGLIPAILRLKNPSKASQSFSIRQSHLCQSLFNIIFKII